MKKSILAISIFVVLVIISAGSSFAEVLEVTPEDAYDMATTDPNAYILDVRTLAEWTWVGHPGVNKQLDGSLLEGKVVNISFMVENKKKQWLINPSFLRDVDDIFEQNPNITLICMCRSGGRGRAAAGALVAAGYDAVNMATGFEGAADEYGYRTLNGWAIQGLPYKVSSPAAIDGYND